MYVKYSARLKYKFYINHYYTILNILAILQLLGGYTARHTGTHVEVEWRYTFEMHAIVIQNVDFQEGDR